MNIKEYISSGIIETYVLGLTSEEERREFEQLCAQYPELVKAREEFELALEKTSSASAVTPPVGMREKIWANIQQSSSSSKLITMPTTTRSRNFNWTAVAAAILFLIAGFFAYKYFNENKNLKTELNNTKEAQARTDEKLKTLEEQVRIIGDVNNPQATVVTLKATKQGNPTTKVVWDSASNNVYLWVKNMPELPNDKQYQLWALIDNKPVDLGLFDAPKDNTIVLLKMKNTQKADAFAITIETRNNTGGPNLEQLQSLGPLH